MSTSAKLSKIDWTEGFKPKYLLFIGKSTTVTALQPKFFKPHGSPKTAIHGPLSDLK